MNTWKQIKLPDNKTGYALITAQNKPYEVDRYTGQFRVHQQPKLESPHQCYFFSKVSIQDEDQNYKYPAGSLYYPATDDEPAVITTKTLDAPAQHSQLAIPLSEITKF